MTASSAPILFTASPQGIATLKLNRPEKHNAFDKNMIQMIITLLETLTHDTTIRLLVIRSTGKTFCAGADLHWMQKSIDYSEKENYHDATLLATMMYKLAHFNKPTLAIVQGPAYGGGIGLIACCKIAIVSTQATFCFSEVKLGLIPAVIAPYIIRAIGPRHALAYFLSSHPFDAATAFAMGLCQSIVPPDNLDHTATVWSQAILQGSPSAIHAIEQFIASQSPPISSDIIEKTATLLSQLRVSSDGQEGLRSFIEKRKPHWVPDE